MNGPFLMVFHAKPDSDECGRSLQERVFSFAAQNVLMRDVESWDDVPDAVSGYVDRHYGDMDYPRSPIECWVWEAGRVHEARRLAVDVRQTISVFSHFTDSAD